jgi:type II secretory pathway pseudopilin PulG
MFKKFIKSKNLRGFTLIELLMASGILMILIGVFTSILTSIIDAQLDSNATSGVDQDGRYVIARLIYDMQRASDIVSPAAPSASASSSLTIKIDAIDNVYSLNSNGNLELNNNLGINILNSYTTRIENLTFQRIGIGGLLDTIQVKFRIISRIAEPSGNETRDFQTTLGLQ